MAQETMVPGMDAPYQNPNQSQQSSNDTYSPYGAPYGQPAAAPASPYASTGAVQGTVVGGMASPYQSAPAADYPGNPAPAAAPQAQPARPQSTSNKPILGFLYSVSRTPLGEYWPLYQGRNSIGREPECDVVLNEASVTRQHASLVVRKNQHPAKVIAAIQDNMSSAGTQVNGTSLGFNVQEIFNGDIIKIGDAYEFVFVLFDTDAQGLKPAENFQATPELTAPAAAPQQQQFDPYGNAMPQAPAAAPAPGVAPSFNGPIPSFSGPQSGMPQAPEQPRNYPINDGTVGMDGLDGANSGGTMV